MPLINRSSHNGGLELGPERDDWRPWAQQVTEYGIPRLVERGTERRYCSVDATESEALHFRNAPSSRCA